MMYSHHYFHVLMQFSFRCTASSSFSGAFQSALNNDATLLIVRVHESRSDIFLFINSAHSLQSSALSRKKKNREGVVVFCYFGSAFGFSTDLRPIYNEFKGQLKVILFHVC